MGRGLAPTAASRIRSRERRARVLEMRLAGASSGQIGQALGISRSQVWRHLKASLAEINSDVVERTEELRAIQAARIEQHISELLPLAAAGDLRAHKELRGWYERQSRLLALDLQPKEEAQEITHYVIDMRPPDQRTADDEAGPVAIEAEFEVVPSLALESGGSASVAESSVDPQAEVESSEPHGPAGAGDDDAEAAL